MIFSLLFSDCLYDMKFFFFFKLLECCLAEELLEGLLQLQLELNYRVLEWL